MKVSWKIIFPALIAIVLLLSRAQVSYASEPAQLGLFQPYVDTLVSYLSEFFPTLKISKPSQSVVFAQTAGFGGGSGALAMYFLETNGVSQHPSTCPVGWSEALYGYGPHYFGVIANDWLANGTRGNGGGFGDVPPPTDKQVPGPGPGTAVPPGIPGPGGGSENGVPPPGPGGGGGEGEPPITPSSGPGGGPVGPNGLGLLNLNRPIASKDDKNLLSLLFPILKANAQSFLTVYTAAVAIGSDSVCSQSDKEVITTQIIFNNNITPPQRSIHAAACYTDPNTNITECNRCRVCTKP